MNYKVYWLLALFGFLSNAKCFAEADGWIVIDLYHALDSTNLDNFSYRGNVTIPNLSSESTMIIQDGLSNQQRRTLKQFAQSNDFYRMRGVVSYGEGMPKQTFLTSTKACALILAQLNDVLWVSTDNAGFVTAITQTTSSSPGQDDCKNLQLSTEEDFNTDIVIRTSELAFMPDTASFIKKIERDREAREKGEVKDNRGFFAKYWMYIVPAMLIIFISGASNQEPGK